MPNKKIQKPHDLYFKGMMKDRQVAQDFLKAHFPKDLIRRMDVATLQLKDASFVDQDLKENYSDLLYECTIDNQQHAYLYILIEAQSTPDQLMPLRMVKYTIGALENYKKQHPDAEKLPVVISACLYHGSQSPYPHTTHLFELFQDPALAKEEMFNSFRLIDLTVMDEKKLSQHGKAAMMELLLQQSHKRDFVKAMKTFIQHGGIYELNDEEIKMSTVYMGSVGEEAIVEKALSLFLEQQPEKRDIIMTYAQSLENRGMQQGIQQGMQQGMQQGVEQRNVEIAKNMLQQGFEPAVIAQLTGLNLQQIQSLR